jgi:excisionase family DNA binding protein
MEEVAHRLRVSRTTVWRLISQGVLTTVQVPGKRGLLVEKSAFLSALFEEDLLTVAEVARRLGSSESSVRRWIRQGALQAILLPGMYRIKKSELQAFVESYGLPPHLRSENLWSTAEIADWLHIDYTTIDKWINRRKLRAIRVKGIHGYRIKETDLLASLGREEIFPEDETVLTTNEIAEWLRIDISTLRRWIKQGKLPAMSFPGEHRERYRVLESDLEQFLGMLDGIPWQEKLLSLPEITQGMTVNLTTIQRWVKQGELPAIIFPGEHRQGYRILESVYDAFVKRWKE